MWRLRTMTFALSHEIIDQAQYSALVAAVIASAVVPTVIANAFFMPRHLLKDATATVAQTAAHEGRAATIVDAKRGV